MALSSKTLQQMAEHVCYEVDQLQGCVALIKGNRFRVQDGGGNRIIANALLESALMHVRSLDDFFGRNRTMKSYVDDVFATDFDPSWPVRRVLSNEERDLLNKRLAHLTTVRIRGQQRWELDLCLKLINAFGDFLDGLEARQPLRRAWFKAERGTVTFRRR